MSPTPAPDPLACEFVIMIATYLGPWRYPSREKVLAGPFPLERAMQYRKHLYRRAHHGWMFGVRHQPSGQKITPWRRGRLEYREAQALAEQAAV